jgi:acetyl esterase/lipase
MQQASELVSQPPAAIFTNGFDPLRDVGIEYAGKLQQAGVTIHWRHYDDLTDGWLQMGAWSNAAKNATREVGQEVGMLLYGETQ